MEISFLDNGLDSLKKGFESLKEYEELALQVNDKTSKKYFKLKDSILNVQHGVEILIKHILNKENELLLFSQIDNHVKNALSEKKRSNLKSVFETSHGKLIHTATFKESLDRLVKICGIDISIKLGKKLVKLEEFRNQIMH